MSNLNYLFERLGSDSELMDAYNKAPSGVMKSSGLSDEEIQTILSGDVPKFTSLAGNDKKFRIFQLIHINDK